MKRSTYKSLNLNASVNQQRSFYSRVEKNHKSFCLRSQSVSDLLGSMGLNEEKKRDYDILNQLKKNLWNILSTYWILSKTHLFRLFLSSFKQTWECITIISKLNVYCLFSSSFILAMRCNDFTAAMWIASSNLSEIEMRRYCLMYQK